MIGYLRGTLIRSSTEGILLDVRGVGYQVRIPLSTFYEIERLESDAELGLWIYTHVREDALDLFGFWTEQEKVLFEKLIGVSGIGPRLAQGMLSGMAPDEILQALASENVAALTRIPGVGKKTAERLVLELKDSARELAANVSAAPQRMQDDLVLALINLGYRSAEAERAVAEARRDAPDGVFHELLKVSLKRLSRV